MAARAGRYYTLLIVDTKVWYSGHFLHQLVEYLNLKKNKKITTQQVPDLPQLVAVLSWNVRLWAKFAKISPKWENLTL